MATTAATIQQLVNNDAEFRSWGQSISNALGIAGGLVRVYAGINWATVTKPAAAGFVANSEVYRFDDALQATSPIFLKVRYGVRSGAIRYRMEWQVGRAHDGAGTLTADTHSAVTQDSGGSSSLATGRIDCSSRPDGLSLVLWPDHGAAASLCILVGRGRNADGTARSDRIHSHMFETSTGTLHLSRIWRPTVGWAGGSSKAWQVPVLGRSAIHSNVGGDIPAVYPAVYSGAEKWEITEGLVYPTGAVTDDTIFTADLPGGATGTFKAIGNRVGDDWLSGAAAAIAGNGFGLRWE